MCMRVSTPILFLICGGFTTTINLVARYFLSTWLPYWLAIVLAYSLGMLIGFVLFKRVVYKAGDSNQTSREIILYLGVNGISMAVTVGISYLFRDVFFPMISFNFWPQDTAHFIGVFWGAVSNFFGHKYITFNY